MYSQTARNMETQRLIQNIKQEPDYETATNMETQSMITSEGLKQEPDYETMKKEADGEEQSEMFPVINRSSTSYPSLSCPDDSFLYCGMCQLKYEGGCPEHGPVIYMDIAEEGEGYSQDSSHQFQVVDNKDRQVLGREKVDQSKVCEAHSDDVGTLPIGGCSTESDEMFSVCEMEFERCVAGTSCGLQSNVEMNVELCVGISLSDLDSDSEFDRESDDINSSNDSDIVDVGSTNGSDSSWSNDSVIARHPFHFTGNDGVKIPIIDANDVLHIFQCISNDSIIKLICDETNNYAERYIAAKRDSVLGMKRRSRLHDWKSTTPEEIRLLEGLFLLMGLIHKPTLQSYFTRNPILNTPIFYQTMKNGRFLLLIQFLHFSSRTDANNKLYKIEDLLQLYRNSFQAAYVPSQNITIGESLLLLKGGLSWKMYIPLKRSRFGIESFNLCEAKTGYVYNFIIYTGRGTHIPITLTDVDPSKQNYSTNIVLSLMQEFLDQGYYLGIDNYYSSVYLFDYLASHKTDIMGTVRKNRKELPRQVISSKLKKGETSVMYRGKTMLMKWKDKKEVLIMSTTHDPTMSTIVARGGVSKQKPEVCIKYKDHMAGVDPMDQMLSSTNSARTYLKKYKKIYLRFLDICVLNAHTIHKKLGGKLTLLDFKLKLIVSLFETYGESTDRGNQNRTSPIATPARLTGRHFLAESPMSGKRHSRRQCVVCNSRKQRTLVMFLCKQCNVYLCPTQCFEDYHTKLNFQ